VFASAAVQLLAGGARFFHAGWVSIVLVGALSLVAGAWLGLGIGRTFPFVLTAPVAAMATLVLAWFGFAGVARGQLSDPLDWSVTLEPDIAGAGDPFVTLAGVVDLAQTIAFVGVAGTGFLLVVGATPRARLIAVLPVALCVALAATLLPQTRAEMYTEDREATALVCSGQVCVTAMHEAELARLAGPAHEALRLLGTLPDAPTSVRETTEPDTYLEARPRTAEVLQVDFDDQGVRGAPPAELTRTLLAGAGTPDCRRSGDAYFREHAARTVAAAWLLGDLEPLYVYRFADREIGELAVPAWAALRALPADEQKARIAAVRAAELTCSDTDPLGVLTG
jgi:hypothetical protein